MEKPDRSRVPPDRRSGGSTDNSGEFSAAMERLARSHERAYLTTQTTSARAIGMYLDFDFVPFITSDQCRQGWRLLASMLDHPALEAYREG